MFLNCTGSPISKISKGMRIWKKSYLFDGFYVLAKKQVCTSIQKMFHFLNNCAFRLWGMQLSWDFSVSGLKRAENENSSKKMYWLKLCSWMLSHIKKSQILIRFVFSEFWMFQLFVKANKNIVLKGWKLLFEISFLKENVSHSRINPKHMQIV